MNAGPLIFDMHVFWAIDIILFALAVTVLILFVDQDDRR
jgi:hypothetical protein